jgi:fatty-acyl-CoA synthase
LARAGAVLVPINFMLNAEEIAYIVRHCGAKVLCTDSGMAPIATAAAKLDTSVEQFVWLPSLRPTEPVEGMVTFQSLLERGAGAPDPQIDLPSDALAQILYTSGTESLPKGAMLTHDAVIAQYASCIAACDFKASDVMVHAMPMFHCAQLDVFVGPFVQVGAMNIIIDAPLPETVFDMIERYAATSFFAPPTVWISLLRSPSFDPARLQSLEKALLWRLDHAGRGADGDAAAAAQGAVLEPVWPDRDCADRDHARPGRPDSQGWLGRQAGAQCRDPGSRRCRQRTAAG